MPWQRTALKCAQDKSRRTFEAHPCAASRWFWNYTFAFLFAPRRSNYTYARVRVSIYIYPHAQYIHDRPAGWRIRNNYMQIIWINIGNFQRIFSSLRRYTRAFPPPHRIIRRDAIEGIPGRKPAFAGYTGRHKVLGAVCVGASIGTHACFRYNIANWVQRKQFIRTRRRSVAKLYTLYIYIFVCIYCIYIYIYTYKYIYTHTIYIYTHTIYIYHISVSF
jgi:hypothetical protein